MKQDRESQCEKLGCSTYINQNCWLAKTLNNSPSKRCQYCHLKFRNCLFFHYLIITLILVFLFLAILFLVEKQVSKLIIIGVFVLVTIYGYFFNKSTEKIIEANFSLKQTNDKVSEQSKDIKEKSQFLQELLDMKTDFLRVVNHQLNTPISIVIGAFSMMDEKIWDTAKSLAVIKAGFERITQTVQDFWDAYELEGEKMEMKPEKTNIAAIVEKLIPEKQKLPLAIERKLSISINEPLFEVPAVWCDPKKITHVISNLLDNGIYYTERGRVAASYELIDKKYLKINITDTGAGISEEDKKRLFQKFSRGKAATSLRPDGSGLGLYIAKKIVESNDGMMTYESKGAGKGSTFSFTAPIYQGQQPSDDQKNQTVKRDKIVIFGKNSQLTN